MFRKTSFQFSLLLVVLSFFSACGYTQKAALPAGIKSIHVDTFKNKMSLSRLYAYEPGLEIKISKAVIRRMNIDGNLKVVSRRKADAILEGDLVALDQEGLRFTGLEGVEEYRLYVVTALRLKNAKTGDIIWEEPNFSGDSTYFVTGARAISRNAAAEQAIERLARNIADRIVEDW